MAVIGVAANSSLQTKMTRVFQVAMTRVFQVAMTRAF
jgi:hypothetical protein